MLIDSNAVPSNFQPPRTRIAPKQNEIIAFLEQPASYGGDITNVEHLETHGAHIFLAGSRVYKIKRAIRYPYLDFSTLEKRRLVCEREVHLNRRTAPHLYIDVVPVTRQSDGKLTISGDGEVVEWMVEMRRFPQQALLENLADQGKITYPLCRRLAWKIAKFHDAAEGCRKDTDINAALDQKAIAEGNFAALRSRSDLFDLDEVRTLEHAVWGYYRSLEPVLLERQHKGFVRLCHGDLHLRNIYLCGNEPVLFDCLEFDEHLATIDVLYDLAFLLMDLDRHGLRQEANTVLNHYLDLTENDDGTACLPLFLAQRAAIRAKVEADAEALTDDPARKEKLRRIATSYLRAAISYTKPVPPLLLCIGGLSGSGKTVLARRIAHELGAPPGAVHLRSDQIRKAICGRPETDRLPAECYNPAVSSQVYRTMRERAARLLRAGRSVVMDAVFNRAEDRLQAQQLADKEAVAFQGIWLEAPDELMVSRVRDRHDDASDATPEIVRQQRGQQLGEVTWPRLDASRDAASVATTALAKTAEVELDRPPTSRHGRRPS